MILSGYRVVTPAGLLDGGRVTVSDGRIAEVVAGAPAGAATPYLLPGFVDMHVHGGGGHTFTTGDPDEARRAAAFHLRHGTTTLLASLVTAPHPLLAAATS